MTTNEGYIIDPKDYSSIVKLQDPQIIEELLDDPRGVLAEILAGWFSAGNGFLAAAGCRIALAAFKGETYAQFSKEFAYLRKAGKIPENFRKKKYGHKTWTELLITLDEEAPDEDRLQALKAMFYSVNKIGADEGERIKGYQLFRIAKELSSSQLLLLKVVKELNRTIQHAETLAKWKQNAAQSLGHGVIGLVARDLDALASSGLVVMLGAEHPVWLSDIGVMFCANIDTYVLDLKGLEDEET